MNYNDWINSVDRTFVSNGMPFKTKYMDKAFLSTAFNAGMSPVDFVHRGSFQFISSAQPPKQPADLDTVQGFFVKLAYWVAIVVVAILAVSFCFLIMHGSADPIYTPDLVTWEEAAFKPAIAGIYLAMATQIVLLVAIMQLLRKR